MNQIIRFEGLNTVSQTNQIVRVEWIICELIGLLMLARQGIVVQAKKLNELKSIPNFSITEPKFGSRASLLDRIESKP